MGEAAQTDHRPPSEESGLAARLELVGKSVALAAVLLPLAGVIVRYVAFSIGAMDTSTPSSLATESSVALLAATGLGSLLGATASLAIIPWLRREELVTATLKSLSPRVERLTSDQLALVRAYDQNKEDFEHLKAAVERGWIADEERVKQELEALRGALERLDAAELFR